MVKHQLVKNYLVVPTVGVVNYVCQNFAESAVYQTDTVDYPYDLGHRKVATL